jgi:amino acid transporter
MGMVTYTVIVALGEMVSPVSLARRPLLTRLQVTVFPLAGGFVYLANRFVDPALGAACGMNYWYGLAVTIPAEISAGSLIISFWETSTPVGVWITMFLVSAPRLACPQH